MSDYRILLPLDGSRLAERALSFVPALRALGDCRLRLVSVVDEHEDFKLLSPEEVSDREFNVLSTYLREVSEDVRRHLGITVETEVKRGTPLDVLLEDARAFSPDLIVISSHGRSGISRWRFGSVADKVIRTAEHNTLVIGPKAAEQSKWLEADLVPAFESILVPLDGSELAQNALPVALRFAEAYKSEIHLVRAIPLPVVPDSLGYQATYQPDLLEDLRAAARSYISELVEQSHFQGTVKTDVLVGPAAHELEDYIKANGIDLVVMTSHGRGGIARATLGSVTDRLLGGEAPVLVVRAG